MREYANPPYTASTQPIATGCFVTILASSVLPFATTIQKSKNQSILLNALDTLPLPSHIHVPMSSSAPHRTAHHRIYSLRNKRHPKACDDFGSSAYSSRIAKMHLAIFRCGDKSAPGHNQNADDRRNQIVMFDSRTSTRDIFFFDFLFESTSSIS